MKTALSVILILFILTSCNKKEETINLKNGLFIQNATIISAQNEEVNSYIGNVIIDHDSIIYTGKKSPILKGNFQTIEGSGKYVIPGLIDSHVHVGHPIGLRDQDYEDQPQLVKSFYNQVPNSYLYFGFTSLIDLDLKERNRKRFVNAEIRPTLYSAGRGIRYYNGYGQSLFPKKVRYRIFPNWVYDEEQKNDIDKSIDLNEHTVASNIQKSIDANAVCIKTYYENGFGVFNWPVPSDKLLKEIVDQSHAVGLPVALHATSYDSYQKGLKAGVDIFAHGLWHWEGPKLNASPPLGAEELYKKIALSGKYVQSTMRVILGEYDTYNWSLINHPDLKHALSPDFIKWLSSEEGKWPQRDIKELYDKNKKDKTIPNEKYFEAINQRIKNTVKLAFKNKVKLLIGSDSPASEGIGNVPGLNGYLEIDALSASGVSHEEIFIAATYRNAKAFGLHNSIGSIEKGKKADLLILNSNPLENVKAYNQIESIVLSGKIYDRAKFSASNN